MDVSTIVAIIAAVFGGAGVKMIEKWLNRSVEKEDSGFKLRTELREELERLRDELEKTKDELDDYRAKYFSLMEQFSKTKIELETALYKIQQQASAAQNAIKEDDGE
jgi:predicted  nucleic acid-binding Zn-ribbon protein